VRMRVAAWVSVLVALVPFVAHAQEQVVAASPGNQTLKRLSIEDLSSIDVTSTLKHAEPVVASAAAIEVITGDDIRRAGITTLPEALRLVVTLAETAGQISARGDYSLRAAKEGSDEIGSLVDAFNEMVGQVQPLCPPCPRWRPASFCS
jgi:methyl-accepting chemotaxis protein